MHLFDKVFSIFDDMKVRYKLLGIYIIVTLVPILLVGIYLNYGMREVVLNNTLSETNANIDKLELQLNNIIDRATNISDLIYINKDLESLLLEEYENNLEIYNAYNRYPIFDEYLKYYNEIENIQFFMTKKMITNSYFVHADQEIRKEDWYQQALSKKGYVTWLYKEDIWTKKEYMTLTRAVYASDNSLLGILCIYISPDSLRELSSNEVYDAYISLNNETIVHNKNRDLIGTKPSFLAHLSNEINSESFVLDTSYLNEQVKINVRSFQPQKALDTSVQISTIIPVEDVMREPNIVIIKGFIVIIGSILISIILIILFIRSFDRRLHELKHAMNKVSKGNFNIRKQIAGKDEIGEVYRELYITAESIKKLINEVYVHKIKEERWKRKQKESEFKMLASQINPHFLYNTLEMIRMKAFINKDVEVANSVKLLSKIMRSSLERTDKPIPLEKEIDLVSTYLKIQKLRFGDKIDYDIETNCNIENYMVFPLLLQPIVENSVIHGIENKEGEGQIKIDIFEDNTSLVIQVKDNGVGITEPKLDKLKFRLSESEEQQSTSNRIGVFNVHQRIRLHYGDSYGLRIKSEVNKGTSVTLHLPLWKGQDSDA
ncbi:histidine kinase [Aquibacillus rhizosphaerae]|uniref:histidine kinase n=1 Tax=Aquibacillus rhizosphaerae TaxID=3051431 RepID=A0ABT7LBH9_9BACI|nr:histidine kinase [Aquibacillus sp. LR5S19]MDL4841896.1 histidine kinase [Aquibacillus sp. LR5S19]